MTGVHTPFYNFTITPPSHHKHFTKSFYDMTSHHKGVIMTRHLVKAITAASLCFITVPSLFAQQNRSAEIVDIGKVERSMNIHKEKRHTLKPKNISKKHHVKQHKQMKKRDKKRVVHMQKKRKRLRHTPNNVYDKHHAYHDRHYARAYRHFRRTWMFAYLYDRADFYDRDGFHYGYFDRYGYMFEGRYYRYDRYYRYQDRLRGRGLHDRFYYRPCKRRHYGLYR